MALDLFGFTISRKGEEKEEQNVKSFVPVARDDGAMEVSAMGGAYGTVVDLEGSAKNEAYRGLDSWDSNDQLNPQLP